MLSMQVLVRVRPKTGTTFPSGSADGNSLSLLEHFVSHDGLVHFGFESFEEALLANELPGLRSFDHCLARKHFTSLLHRVAGNDRRDVAAWQEIV